MKRILVGFGLALMLCLSGFSDNVFTGSLEIRLASNNSLKKSVPVLASGTGSKSGTVGVHYLGLKKGTRYKAVLNGVLKDTAGTMMYVDNNVQITFTY